MSNLISIEPLYKGESALDDSPLTKLNDGSHCIPQHYLSYQHTLESVEALVLKMEYSDKFPIFVFQENQDIIIQIGIIGQDNYLSKKDQTKAKIVYGRKWRVEPNLPTSEIIQTVFLALKKAREHEIRELLRIQVNQSITTPFNNHHDAPLISKNSKAWESAGDQQITSKSSLKHILKHLKYDGVEFDLNSLEKRDSGQWLVELSLYNQSASDLLEMSDLKNMSFLIDQLSINHFLHGLMTTLIQLSDRHVDEHFLFEGVARFSWNLDILRIAKLSSETRRLHLQNDKWNFFQDWKHMNYETDTTRVPTLSNSPLSTKLKGTLCQFNPLDGVLPNLL